MTRLLFILLVIGSLSSTAQSKKVRRSAETLSVADLKERLTVLSSDSMGGRETGEKGQKMAMEYIRNHFKQIGLEAPVKGSYIQEFELEKATWREIYLRRGDQYRRNLSDFLYYSSWETKGEEYAEFVFVTDSSEFSSMDLKDKYVVMQSQSWGGWNSKISKLNIYEPRGYVIATGKSSELEFAMSRFKSWYTEPRISRSFQEEGERVIISSLDLIEWVFESEISEIRPSQTAKLIFNADRIIEPVTSENVMGLLRGASKPDEILILTSHYDHIGINSDGEINNGADDDGSGTTAIMELAETFAEAAEKGLRPDRSILFLCVSGEEKGLLGSKYYTDESPVFPLENTIVNLNMDMIGRVDPKHEGNPNYIYVIGADKLSTELHELHERVNANTVNLEFDYTYNDENDPNRFYYRSDHYNFAKNNIPIIFYFNGTHADYHKPTDTIEKINFDRIRSVAQLVYYTAWEIANKEGRLILD